MIFDKFSEIESLLRFLICSILFFSSELRSCPLPSCRFCSRFHSVMRTETVLNFFIQLIFSHVICALRDRSIMISVLKRDVSFVSNSFLFFPIARCHQKFNPGCTWGLISSSLPSAWMSTRSRSLIGIIFSLTASSHTFATITDIHEVFDTFWNEDILSVCFSPMRMDGHMSCVTRSSKYESTHPTLNPIS